MGASIAGLSAASGLLDDPAFAETAKGLEDLLLRDFVRNGSLVKHDATAAVDASLLWLALPLGVVATDDPLFVETARRVDDELEAPGGGIRRYLGDTFYGGGEWLLLTCWSGWVHAAAGRAERAMERLAWWRFRRRRRLTCRSRSTIIRKAPTEWPSGSSGGAPRPSKLGVQVRHRERPNDRD